MLNLKAMRAQKQKLGHHYPLGLNHHPSRLNSRELTNKKTLYSLDILNFYPNGFPSISQQVESLSIEQSGCIQKTLDDAIETPGSQQKKNQNPKYSQVENSDSANTLLPYKLAASQFEGQSNFEKSSNAESNIVVPTDLQSVQKSNFSNSPQRQHPESTQNNQIGNLDTTQSPESFRTKIQQYFSDDSENLQDSARASLEISSLSKANPPGTDTLQKSSTKKETTPSFTSSQADLVKSKYQLQEFTSTTKDCFSKQFNLIGSGNNNSLTQRSKKNQFSSLNSASSDIEKEEKSDSNSDFSKSSLTKTGKEENTNGHKKAGLSTQLDPRCSIENHFQVESQSQVPSSIFPKSIASKELEDIQENLSSLVGRGYSKSTNQSLDYSSTPISIQRDLETSEENRKNHQLINSENRDTTQTSADISQSESTSSLVDNFPKFSDTVYSPSLLESVENYSTDMFSDSGQSSQSNFPTLNRYPSSSIQNLSVIQDNEELKADLITDQKDLHSSNYDFSVQRQSVTQPFSTSPPICREKPLDALEKNGLDEQYSRGEVSLAESSINYSFLPTQLISKKGTGVSAQQKLNFLRRQFNFGTMYGAQDTDINTQDFQSLQRAKDFVLEKMFLSKPQTIQKEGVEATQKHTEFDPIKSRDAEAQEIILQHFAAHPQIEFEAEDRTYLFKKNNDSTIEDESRIPSRARVNSPSEELISSHCETITRDSTGVSIRKTLEKSNSLQDSILLPESFEDRSEILASKNAVVQNLSRLDHSYNELSQEPLQKSFKSEELIEQNDYIEADTPIPPSLQTRLQRENNDFSLQLFASTAISNVDGNMFDRDKGSQHLFQSATQPSTSHISLTLQAIDEKNIDQLFRTPDYSEPTIQQSSIFADFLNQSSNSVDTYQPYSSDSTEPLLLAKVEGMKTGPATQYPNASSVVSNNSKSDSVLHEKNTTLNELRLHGQTLISKNNDYRNLVVLDTPSYGEKYSEEQSQKTTTGASQLKSPVKDNIGSTTQRDLDIRASLSAKNDLSNPTEEILQDGDMARKDESIFGQPSLIDTPQDHKIQKIEVTENLVNQESGQANRVEIDSHSEKSLISSSKTPTTFNTEIDIERSIVESNNSQASKLFTNSPIFSDNHEELDKKKSKYNCFNLSTGNLGNPINDVSLSSKNLSKSIYLSTSTELILPLLNRKELYNQTNFEGDISPGILPILQASFLQLASRSSQRLSTPIDIALSELNDADRDRSSRASLQLTSKPMLSSNYVLPVLQSKDEREISQRFLPPQSSAPKTLLSKIVSRQKYPTSNLSSHQIGENSVEKFPPLWNPAFEETKQTFSQKNQPNNLSRTSPGLVNSPQQTDELNSQNLKANQTTKVTLLSRHMAQHEPALPTLPSILKKFKNSQYISSLPTGPTATSLFSEKRIQYHKSTNNSSEQKSENVSPDNSDIHSNAIALPLCEGISLQSPPSHIARQPVGKSSSPKSRTTTDPFFALPLITLTLPGQLNLLNQIGQVQRKQDSTDVFSTETISSLQNSSTNLSESCDAVQKVDYKNETPVQFSSVQGFVSQENNFLTPRFSNALPAELSNLQDFAPQAVEGSPSILKDKHPSTIQLALKQDKPSLSIQPLSLTYESMDDVHIAEVNQSINTSSTLSLSPSSLHPLPLKIQPRLTDEENLGSKVKTPASRANLIDFADQVASTSQFGLAEQSSILSQTKAKIYKIATEAVQKNPLAPILLDTSLVQEPTNREIVRATFTQKQPTASIFQPSSLQVASQSSQQLSTPVDIAMLDVSGVDGTRDNQILLQLTSGSIAGASHAPPASGTKKIIKANQQLIPLDPSESNTRLSIRTSSIMNSSTFLNLAFEKTKNQLDSIASASLKSANSPQKLDEPCSQEVKADQDITTISSNSYGLQPKFFLPIPATILQRSKNFHSLYSLIDPISTNLALNSEAHTQEYSNNASEQKPNNFSSENSSITLNSNAISLFEGISLQRQASDDVPIEEKNIVMSPPNLGLDSQKWTIQSGHLDILRDNKNADTNNHLNPLDSPFEGSSYQALIPSSNQVNIFRQKSINSKLQQEISLPQLPRALETIDILQPLLKPSFSGSSQSKLDPPQSHKSRLISIKDTEKLGEKLQQHGKNAINISRSIASSSPRISSKPLQEQTQKMNSSNELPVEWSNLQDFALQAADILEVKQPLQTQSDLEQDQTSLPVQLSSLTQQSIEGVQGTEANKSIKSSTTISLSVPSLDLSSSGVQPSLIDTENLESKAKTLTDWSNLGSLVEQLASTSKSSLPAETPFIVQAKPQEMKVSKKMVQAKPLASVLPNTSLLKRSINKKNPKPNSIQKQPIENTLQASLSHLQSTADDYVTISANDEKMTLSTSQSIEILAQEMYSLLKQRLNIEKERRGG